MAARQERLVRQFFGSMPIRARVLLYFAVFCCFAPLGLLTSAGGLAIVPWWEVAIITLFSGSIAVAFAVTATLRPRWMPLPIAVHLILTFAIARWLPDRPDVDSLDAAGVAAFSTRLQILSLLIMVSMMGAFIFFWTAIRREGLRFTTAHAEIRLAREIHASLVPLVQGRTTQLEWRGRSQPSGDVGGDLVDVVWSDDGWTATVADVSGHGVASGVMMGMYKTAFRTTLDAEPGADAGPLLTRINRVTSQLRQPHMLITAATLRVDASLRVSYVLAGHPPMLHLSAASSRAAWVGESQLALALIDDAAYDTHALTLEAGDVLIVVTDGLVEVFDREDRELGLEGLRAAVEQTGSTASLDTIEAAIFEVCRRHGVQTDDQSVLVLRARTH